MHSNTPLESSQTSSQTLVLFRLGFWWRDKQMPNQFSTNYGPIPSLFPSEKSKLNFNRRVEDSYFNWKTRMQLWFRVLPPANAVGLGCHLFSLPLKKKLCPQWPHSVHSRCNWFCGYFTSPIDTTNDWWCTNQARKEKQTRKGKKRRKNRRYLHFRATTGFKKKNQEGTLQASMGTFQNLELLRTTSQSS